MCAAFPHLGITGLLNFETILVLEKIVCLLLVLYSEPPGLGRGLPSSPLPEVSDDSARVMQGFRRHLFDRQPRSHLDPVGEA